MEVFTLIVFGSLALVLLALFVLGRSPRSIGQLTGRTDDMVKVKGVAVFPAQVESVLARVEGVGSEYQLHIRREPGHGDVLLVRVEAEEREGLREDLVHQLREGLSVRPEVELVEPGGLPRSERKTQRVFDHRPT